MDNAGYIKIVKGYCDVMGCEMPTDKNIDFMVDVFKSYKIERMRDAFRFHSTNTKYKSFPMVSDIRNALKATYKPEPFSPPELASTDEPASQDDIRALAGSLKEHFSDGEDTDTPEQQRKKLVSDRNENRRRHVEKDEVYCRKLGKWTKRCYAEDNGLSYIEPE